MAEAAEDYSPARARPEGYWLGQGAAKLGLAGKVGEDELVAMLTGRPPLTAEPLGLKSAPGREPVPGFDLTFSTPKSVSVTWALGGHPVSSQVAEAHRAAVREALAYLERQACWARRGKGGAEFVHGEGFLAAAYRHRSSRAGDPQLHTPLGRQHDPRPRQPLVKALPPGDLRTRENRLLHLRGTCAGS